MPRNTVFGRGRDWRPEDDRYRGLHLGPEAGARAGEYDPYSSSEYSDSYYGPADDYARRSYSTGYNRSETDPTPPENRPIGGVVGRVPPAHWSSNQLYGNVQSYGELHPGEPSWADLGASSVHPGEGGITEARQSLRGRGPRGYKRSDERIKEIICEHLTEHPYIDASDIEVEVIDGEVRLTGSVSDRRAKRLVEEVVADCSGDAPIDNRLSHSRVE